MLPKLERLKNYLTPLIHNLMHRAQNAIAGATAQGQRRTPARGLAVADAHWEGEHAAAVNMRIHLQQGSRYSNALVFQIGSLWHGPA